MATCPVQWWTVPKGSDPRTGHPTKGTTRTTGWHPEEKEAQLPLVSEKRYSQISVGCVCAQMGGGPRTPVRQREGTRGPPEQSQPRPKRLDGATLRSHGVFVQLASTWVASRLLVHIYGAILLCVKAEFLTSTPWPDAFHFLSYQAREDHFIFSVGSCVIVLASGSRHDRVASGRLLNWDKASSS